MTSLFQKDKIAVESALQWAYAFLQDRGCLLKGEFSLFREKPWSSIYKINTSVGDIFLKQVSEPFAGEARFLLHLGCLFPDKVPEIVGHNDGVNCFLMFDAGTPLRENLKINYDLALVRKILSTYAQMQQSAIADYDALFSMGTPLWDVEQLPFLYYQLLKQKEFLKADGLTDIALEQLKRQGPRITLLCDKLLEYAIPATLEHGDFHDNNILINKSNELIFADWGEAVITHPFFSAASFFYSAERQHKIVYGSAVYYALHNAYLETWQAFEPKTRLQEAMDLVEKLNPIKFSLSLYRLFQSTDKKYLDEYKGIITKTLTRFLLG